ncbi:MAG: LPXTG cell wall anchor domain-containing protein [Coriobacteriales bacterium]|nr:LPXTG cell wall anchor domain-containing protein [Coriobacteriales bacterium]
MKSKTTIKLIALLAVMTAALLVCASVAVAAPQPHAVESAAVEQDLAIQHEAIHEAVQPGDVPEANPDGESGDADEPEEECDEPDEPDEDVPDDEGDVPDDEGDVPDDEGDVPEQEDEPQEETRTVDTTPTAPSDGGQLAYTGGDQMIWIVGGALIAAAGAGLYVATRRRKVTER